jgi:hypothetical protein
MCIANATRDAPNRSAADLSRIALLDWDTLAPYKEVVINGLDLLSFLLVTPEAFRYIKPAFAGVASAIMIVVLYLIVFGVTTFLVTFFGLFLFPRALPLLAAIATGLVTAGLIAAVAFLPTPRIDRVSARATANGAMIGIVLFLLTRSFALALALHELGR